MVINGFAVAALAAGLLVVAVVGFFMLREFFLWYWRQTEQTELLKRVAEALERIELQRAPARP